MNYCNWKGLDFSHASYILLLPPGPVLAMQVLDKSWGPARQSLEKYLLINEKWSSFHEYKLLQICEKGKVKPKHYCISKGSYSVFLRDNTSVACML